MDPFTPILFLSIGAVAVVIGSNRNYGFYGFTASIAIVSATAATFLLGYRMPATVVLSPWQTQSVFIYPLSLTVDKGSWYLALLLVVTIMCLLLVSLSERLRISSQERAVCLIIVAFTLLVLFSDNLVTLVLALTVLDLCNGLFVFLFNSRGHLSRDIKYNLQVPEIVRYGINVLAVGLVLLVALGDYKSLQSHSQTLSSEHAAILIIVAILRINIYPVNVGLVLSHISSRFVMTVISLVNVIIAVDILASFGLHNDVASLRGGLTVLAVISGLVGGYRWCTATKRNEHLHSLLLAQSSLAVLIFLWAEDWALFGVFAHMITIAFSVIVIYMSDGLIGRSANKFIRPVVTALVFGCQPLTAGFWGVFVLCNGIMDNIAWSVFVIPSIVLINGLTVLGGWRFLRVPLVKPIRQPPLVVVSNVLAFCVPLLASLAVGIIPSKFSSLLGLPIIRFWVSLASPSALAALGSAVMSVSLSIVLWYYRSMVVSRSKDISESWFGYVADLRWLHLLIWRIYRWLVKAIRVFGDILEGQGGILWSLVIVFAILVVAGG